MKLSVIIPAYNEEFTISRVIEAVKAVDLPAGVAREILVVDDGSTDGTLHALSLFSSDPSVRIIKQPLNKGKTAAIRRGLEAVSGDLVVIQDADLEYDPTEYPAMLAPIIEGRADIVYGSRFKGSIRKMKNINRLANIFSNLTFNFLFGQRLTDINTCFKLFRTSDIRSISICSSHFAFETEVTAKLIRKGLRIVEVPISYEARSIFQGKKIDWTRAIGMYLAIIKYRFDRDTIQAPDATAGSLYDILAAQQRIDNYPRWIHKNISPYIKGDVLDIGSGLGSIVRFFKSLEIKSILPTDVNERMLVMLRGIVSGNEKFMQPEKFDISSSEDMDRMGRDRFDTVTCVNVVEHILDDETAFKNTYALLRKGGRLCLVVPAIKGIYGSLDEMCGHHRRYSARELKAKLIEAGFSVKKLYFMNMFGVITWFFAGKIFRCRKFSDRSLRVLDKLVPTLRAMEHFVCPPFGQSIVAIAIK